MLKLVPCELLELPEPHNIYVDHVILLLRPGGTPPFTLHCFQEGAELVQFRGEVYAVSQQVEGGYEVAPLYQLPQGTTVISILGKLEVGLVGESSDVN